MESQEVQLVKIGNLGKAFFRPISEWQPDQICRTCERKTDFEITTEKDGVHGSGYSIPSCKNQECYDGGVGQIRNINKSFEGKHTVH